MTIVDLFEEKVGAYPEKKAVTFEKISLTYSQLNVKANQLANFILSRNYERGAIVGLMLDNSIHSIVSILGILKAGYAFLPIDPSYPRQRIRQIVYESAIPLLISERKYVTLLNKLQWECTSLRNILCCDTDNIYEEKEVLNEKMKAELWNYVGEVGEDDISSGGWASSYTGEFLSRAEMDEYADNIFHKLRPYVNREMRVLEIGCSSGISMFKVAPLVASYHGIDISEKILANTQQNIEKRGLKNITLQCRAAHQIDELVLQSFDVVIINSVIQSFNGYNYLRDVIKKAISLIGNEGVIFIGDILNSALKSELETSCLEFKKNNPKTSVRTKTDWSSDLFVHKDFFDDLSVDFAEIEDVQHSDKLGALENELTKFRYDTILNINKTNNKRLAKKTKLKYQYTGQMVEKYSGRNPRRILQEDDLAYVLYTSGSTGHPKGVMITHGSLTNYVHWFIDKYALGPQDRTTLLSKLTFDGSYPSLWGTLLVGGHLDILSPVSVIDPERMLASIVSQRNSFIKASPALFNIFLQTKGIQRLKSLRQLRLIIIGGESINVSDIQEFFDLRDDVTIVNHYGPTECTIAVTVYDITKDNLQEFVRRPLIGKPIANTQIYILGENQELLPPNVAGELYIGGKCLAKGYLNNNCLTEERFVEHLLSARQGRWYKTGDKGRWLFNGNIEYLGRNDDQVKIRGYRVELSEVERHLVNHPGIAAGSVVVHQDRVGHISLVAYYVTEALTTTENLKSYLQNHLPDYMLPAYFVEIPSLPRLPNGKIDKSGLPSPDEEAEGEPIYLPQTSTEASLTEVWKEQLGKTKIGINQNFFELGGHSLKATQLVSRIYKIFNVEIRLREIFEHPTIKDLSRLIDLKDKKSFSKIARLPKQAYYETSFGQKRLWFLSLLEKSSNVYTEVSAKKFHGALNVKALKKAFQSLVIKHEILRTNFRLVDGRPVQKIKTASSVNFELQVIDISASKDQKYTIEQHIAHEQQRVFNLEKDFLLGGKIVKLSDEVYVFILSFHHIIADGWSLNQVMIPELIDHYNQLAQDESPRVHPLDIQYKEFAEWQNQSIHSSNAKPHKTYWLTRFRDEIPLLDLPTDFSRPDVKSGRGAVEVISFDKETRQGLENLVRDGEATLFQLLLSLVYVLMYRYTGQSDIIIGTPVSGRDHLDLENQIGFFVNTLAIRTDFSSEDTFHQLLEKVKQSTLEAFDHQSYPFDKLVEDLQIDRVLSRNPLFDVMVIYNQFKASGEVENSFKDLSVEAYPTEPGVSKFDLTFNFQVKHEGLYLQLEYDSDLFLKDRIVRMLEHLQRLCTEIIKKTEQPIRAINYLSELEHRQLIHDFQSTLDFPQGTTFVQLFEAQARLTPNQVAVVYDEVTWTYEELNNRANQFAYELQYRWQVQPEDIVGVYMERSHYMLLSIISIFKLGGTYLPLDPHYPNDRINYILNDAKPKVVVFAKRPDSAVADNYDTVNVHTVLENTQAPNKNQEASITATSLAYIIYTSGSTGKPKGVMVEHGGMLNHLYAKRVILNLSSKSVIGQNASQCFDISMWQFLSALLVGGRTVIFPDTVIRDVELFVDSINHQKITILQVVPSYLSILLDYLTGQESQKKFSALKYLVLIGEVLPTYLANKWLESYPDIRMVNSYGPTEASDAITHFLVKQPIERSVPVGNPIPNIKIYIVDKDYNLCPIGVRGDIVVGGICVGRGYLNNQAKTAAAFVENTLEPGGTKPLYRTGDVGSWQSDGIILFHGRKDSQVKIRGHRIELGEIESVLRDHPLVESAVVAVKKKNNESHIVGYYVSSKEIDNQILMQFIARDLPSFMLPGFLVKIGQIPLNQNGKIDRSKLPDSFIEQGASEYVPARDELDDRLLSLWAEVLETDSISVTDDFFKLGGHSLRAVQLILKIEQEFDMKVSIKDVFNFPVLKNLADLLKQKIQSTTDPSIKPVEPADYYPVSATQKQFFILSQLEDTSTAYNSFSALTLKGPLDVDQLEYALTRLIAKYEILRTNFVYRDGEVVQKISKADECSVELPVVDMRPATDKVDTVLKLIGESRTTPFELGYDQPLFRLKLLQLEDEHHIVLFTIHHIISDEHSLQIIFRDLSHFYNAGEEEDPNPIHFHYKDYVAWQSTATKKARVEAQKKYWMKKLNGAEVLNFPGDFPRPLKKTYTGDVSELDIDYKMMESLGTIAQENKATVYMALVAVLNLLLYRYTHQKDIVIGLPVSGRFHHELTNQIGPYINTIALRTQVDEEASFLELLEVVRQDLIEGYEHAEYPFISLVKDLKLNITPDRSPLFDVMVSYQDIDRSLATYQMTGLRVDAYHSPIVRSQFDLAFDFSAYESWMKLVINYNTDLFKPSTIALLENRFMDLLEQVIAQPQIAISKITFKLGVVAAEPSDEWQFDY